MRIPSIRPGESTRIRKTDKTSHGEKGAFDTILRACVETGVDGAPALDGGTSLQGIDMLLALQNVDTAGPATGRAQGQKPPLRWAEDVLDDLDGLRVSLLSGAVPRRDLERMRQMVYTHRPDSEDPRLSALLQEIELRVEVELAKLSKT